MRTLMKILAGTAGLAAFAHTDAAEGCAGEAEVVLRIAELSGRFRRPASGRRWSCSG